MFRILGKQRKKTVAVADISSGRVSVAIIEISHKGVSNVLAEEHVTLPFPDGRQEASVAGIIKTLGEVSEKAIVAYSKKSTRSPRISSVYACLHTPFICSKTIRAEHAFNDRTLIGRAIISDLGRQALETDTELAHKKIFESSVVRIELNGYPTANPEGKYASRIAASILFSEDVANIRSGISETLSRVFACPSPKVRSSTSAILSVLKENDILKKYCFVVDMGSQATSLMTVRKDVATEIVHVPEGSLSILKRIAGEKMPEETLTLLRMLALGECESGACETIKQAVARAEPDLVRIFGEAMAKMALERRLPDDLILIAPKELSEWLMQFFSRLDFAQFTITTRPFSPRVPFGQAPSLTLENGVSLDSDLSIMCALVNIEEMRV
ncbi:MAG: hypothetical protein AAB947_00120 [Patescibacteria group bacterium]